MSLDVSLVVDGREVFTANITHNLGRMALACDLYAPVWRPGLLNAETASDLIEPLREGLRELESDRERFERYNPANAWGDYDSLVRFVRVYADACERWPDARVQVWA